MARLAALDDRPRPGKEPTTLSAERPRPGWYLWPATRPRSTAIRMNCGRHGFWPAMRASADRRRVTNVFSPVWLKAPCVHSFGQEEIKPHKVRLLSGTPRRRVRAQDGGSSVCLPRGPGPEKSRCQGGRNRRSRSRSSLTTRSLESRPSPRRHRICRQCRSRHASFARDHEYKRHGTRSSLLAGIDLLTGKVHALVRSATAAASSSNSSSFSMPPIRPAPRSG